MGFHLDKKPKKNYFSITAFYKFSGQAVTGFLKNTFYLKSFTSAFRARNQNFNGLRDSNLLREL